MGKDYIFSINNELKVRYDQKTGFYAFGLVYGQVVTHYFNKDLSHIFAYLDGLKDEKKDQVKTEHIKEQLLLASFVFALCIFNEGYKIYKTDDYSLMDFLWAIKDDFGIDDISLDMFDDCIDRSVCTSFDDASGAIPCSANGMVTLINRPYADVSITRHAVTVVTNHNNSYYCLTYRLSDWFRNCPPALLEIVLSLIVRSLLSIARLEHDDMILSWCIEPEDCIVDVIPYVGQYNLYGTDKFWDTVRTVFEGSKGRDAFFNKLMEAANASDTK